MYGRFDFSFQEGTPKLLEFNADTPTSLVEASVAQWFWFQDKFGQGPDAEKVLIVDKGGERGARGERERVEK